jgi:pyruvate ferredoxin oxidoreductase alpha subunit
MPEQKTVATTGNSVVAEAFRQCAPDVVAAYPITPQTTIVEEFAKIVAQGASTLSTCASSPSTPR